MTSLSYFCLRKLLVIGITISILLSTNLIKAQTDYNKYEFPGNDSSETIEKVNQFKRNVIEWFPYLSMMIVNKLADCLNLSRDEWKLLLLNKETFESNFKVLNLSQVMQSCEFDQISFQNELSGYGRGIIEKAYPNDTFIVGTILDFFMRETANETIELLFNEESLKSKVIMCIHVFWFAPKPSIFINFEFRLKDWFRENSSMSNKFLSFLWAKRSLDFETLKHLSSSKENLLASQYLKDFYKDEKVAKENYFS